MSSAKLAATFDGGRATFLLEMALDEARVRERFAAALLRWRTDRGHGDPQRFPQLEASQELGTGYRTYQSWEAGRHLPRRWSDIERILDLIGSSTGELLDGPELPANGDGPLLGGDDDALTRHQEVLGRLDAIESQLRRIAVATGAEVEH